MALSIIKKGLAVILTYNSKKEEADKVVDEIKTGGGAATALQLNVEDSFSFGAFFNEVKKRLQDCLSVPASAFPARV